MAERCFDPLDMDFFDGIHPSGIGRAIYSMRKGLRLQFLGTGNIQMHLCGLLVPEILDHPSGTWLGLQRLGAMERFCFAGKPIGETIPFEIQKPDDSTFLLFIDEDFEVLKYGWEEDDKKKPGFPIGHDDPNRFGRQLWPTP